MKSLKTYPVMCVNCCETAFSFNHKLQHGDMIFLEYIKEHRMHCGNCGIPIQTIEKSVFKHDNKYWAIGCEAMKQYFPDPEIKTRGKG